MSANKYLGWDATLKRVKEVLFTVISAGVANANQGVGLDATGHIDVSVLPVGLGPTVVVLPASENLAAGAFVNIFDSGAGVMKVRNAIATAFASRAQGFVLAAVISGANATVYSNEINTSLSGLTPGDYFLSDTTSGAATLTPPTAATRIIQRLGNYVSATELLVDIDETPIELS